MRKTLIALITAVLLVAALALCAIPAKDLWDEFAFYLTDHTQTELSVKAFAEDHHIFYRRYPASLISLLERNPETAEFVLNYPTHAEEVTTLEGTSRRTVPLFLQWDPRWGYVNYGSDVIGITGCGPTCLAMVHYYFTGDESMTPAAVARFSTENGYYEMGQGSKWTLFSEGGVQLGLNVRELTLSQKQLEASLEAGRPLILSMGPGDFTTAGHFIVLTGVEDGKFRVNDPNSRIRSQRLWSYEEIADQIRNIWEISYTG